MEHVQSRATELGRVCIKKHKTDEKRLRELGVFSLGNMRLKDGLIILYSYMKGGCSQVGIAWRTQVTHNETRGNGIKMS